MHNLMYNRHGKAVMAWTEGMAYCRSPWQFASLPASAEQLTLYT